MSRVAVGLLRAFEPVLRVVHGDREGKELEYAVGSAPRGFRWSTPCQFPYTQ
jgi:hypothetical protein